MRKRFYFFTEKQVGFNYYFFKPKNQVSFFQYVLCTYFFNEYIDRVPYSFQILSSLHILNIDGINHLIRLIIYPNHLLSSSFLCAIHRYRSSTMSTGHRPQVLKTKKEHGRVRSEPSTSELVAVYLPPRPRCLGIACLFYARNILVLNKK